MSQSRKAFGRSVPQWDRSRKTKLNVEKVPEQKAIPRSVPDWHKTRERIANIRKDLDKKVQQEAVSIDSKRNRRGGKDLSEKVRHTPQGEKGNPKQKRNFNGLWGKKLQHAVFPCGPPPQY